MISYVKIDTPPSDYPVSIENIKAHAVIEHDLDDWLLNSYIGAALSELDPPHGILGRAIMEQSLIAYLPSFDNDRIFLPYPPLKSVTSISYQDTNGSTQVIDESKYIVTVDIEPGRIELLPGESWPTDTSNIVNPIWINYVAGYTDVPEGIRFYIMLLVAEMYRQRELSTTISTKNNPLWMNLIEKYRFRFAGWE